MRSIIITGVLAMVLVIVILVMTLIALAPNRPVGIGDTFTVTGSDTEYVCKIIESDGGLVLNCLD